MRGKKTKKTFVIVQVKIKTLIGAILLVISNLPISASENVIIWLM
jgi:hypothetical protein